MSKQHQLPNKIINFNSAYKDFHQKPDEDDIANFPSPVIAILFGNVNCGKSRLIKNILVHKAPVYERIVIYTPLEETNEYDDVEAELINEIPDLSFFDKDIINCLILEDIDPKNLTRAERARLSALFRLGASHKNIDIYNISQDPNDLLPVLRRLANVVIMWENCDLVQMARMAKKLNIDVYRLKHVFNNICTDRCDSFCISDITPKQRFRKNLLEPINL